MEVVAKKVADYDSCNNPGEFFITAPNPAEGGTRRLSFRCPCGCGDLAGIRINDAGNSEGYCWNWNLDEEEPTCTPSIAIGPSNHWHGYLTNGVFRSC